MAVLAHKPKEEKPDLFSHTLLESLRISYQESYDEADMRINKEILIDFMNDVKQKLRDKHLSKHTKARLIHLLDQLQDFFEAQTSNSSLPTAEATANNENELTTTPEWRLHKKFQSSLETKLVSNTPSQ